MMKRLLILFVFLPYFFGCKHGNMYNQLILVDSLLRQEMVDSALQRLISLEIDSSDTEQKAYYCLLKTQALYTNYIPIASDSLINISYDYYKCNGSKERLARTLLYRGNLRVDLGMTAEAMKDYKAAEENVKDVDDEILRHKIFFVISYVNSIHSEYSLALDYLKKAIICSRRAGRNDYLTYDYQKMAAFYYNMAQYDSSLYYINKSIDAINSIPDRPKKNRAQIWTGLGVTCYMMNDLNKAEQALEKSMSIIPLGSTYAALARISLKKKDTLAAIKQLEDGLEISENRKVALDIMNVLSHIAHNRGDYQRAAGLSRQAFALKDSLTRLQQAQNVKAVQIEYDWLKKSEHAATVRRWLWAGIAIAILIGVVAVTIVLYRWNKTRRRLAEERRQMEQLQAEEQQVNKELSKTKNTVERLKRARQEQDRAMNSCQREWERHGKAMERGHRLFMQLNNGGSIAKWSSDDFKDFRTYYGCVDRAFAETIASRYERLSPNLYILAVLEHIGKSDEDIMAVMGLNQGALRTTRTRLNQKQKSHRKV